jgi:hypothetical protein
LAIKKKIEEMRKQILSKINVITKTKTVCASLIQMLNQINLIIIIKNLIDDKTISKSTSVVHKT